MKASNDQRALEGSERTRSQSSKPKGPTSPNEVITVMMIVRRRPEGPPRPGLEDFRYPPTEGRKAISREEFAEAHGAAPDELDQVVQFARSHHLEVVENRRASRSVLVQGTAANVNRAFGVKLTDYDSPRGNYHSYEGPVRLPASLIGIVETVIGLDNQPVPAKRMAADPPNTNPLVPQQVAQLYDFPAGNGAGQTIGIYEMVADTSPGFTAADLTKTMGAFGGGFSTPTPEVVPILGQNNSNVSDPETVLDITVASAIAQKAAIAVYFTGFTVLDVIQALIQMIHPGTDGPFPTVISISYGWSPDDDTSYISAVEYTQMDELFQDAASIGITVLASSGDTGAQYLSPQAQVAYPASDPWVIACGGTTIGNINGASFDEYVWNDTSGSFLSSVAGATGGGVSARWPVPPYQQGFPIPVRNGTGTPGRGVPDVAGNASVNSGYPEFVGGSSVGPTGGTSAVAPLYAGLIAVMNANLGFSVGFINPYLYALGDGAFRDVVGPPGPTNNSFGGVTGYPAGVGWNACTGLGSINGSTLQSELMLWEIVPNLALTV